MLVKLYLIPNTISEGGDLNFFLSSFKEKLAHLRCFIVEDEASAQRLLKKVHPDFPVKDCAFFILNEHTPIKEVKKIFEETSRKDMGFISEAGCPCVADPGAEIVLLAHQKGIEVIPLVGPSSILLALMASGLNGQNFAFNGYLPREREERIKKIIDLERRSQIEQQTQIFMETPYRNQHMFADLVSCCHPETRLCLAVDIMGSRQSIKTLSMREWKKSSLLIEKKPTVFILLKK